MAAKSRDAEDPVVTTARVQYPSAEGLMRTRMVPFDRLLPLCGGGPQVAVERANKSRWISVTPTARWKQVLERMIGRWSTCCVTR